MIGSILIIAAGIIFAMLPITASFYLSGNDKDHIDVAIVTILVEALIIGLLFIERIK